ncbi:MAG: GNVR domain-containing protein [Sphingomonadaceae bacterium]|nr:GNVR domain-containing protein [Sphingomonadaceae bacterium]
MESTLQQIRATTYLMWRKRWYGLAVAWAVCLIGWLAVALIPNEYKSDARVYVRYNALLPSAMGLDRGGGAAQLAQVDIVRRTLTSRPNLEKVLRRTDLNLSDVSPAELDNMINKLVKSITVTPQGAENLYEISYTASRPGRSEKASAAFAQKVVQNLIDIFSEENFTSDRDNLNQAVRFLDEQIASREQQLAEAETRNAQFEQKYLGMLPGEGDLNSRISQVRSDLGRVSDQLLQARSSLMATQAQIGSTSPYVDGPVMMIPGQNANFGTGTRFDPASARGRVELLERQISDAIARGYTEKHPDVVNAREQIRRLQSQASAEEKKVDSGGSALGGGRQPNPLYVTLRGMSAEKQAEVAALSARQAQLAGDLAKLTSSQLQSPQVAAERARLNRDYNVLKAGYEDLLKSRETVRLRADVATQTNQIQFQTVDPPSLPLKPVAPNRLLLVTLVLLGGIGAGLGAAFLASQLNSAYIDEERLAVDTGLPVLGSVTEVVQPATIRRERLMLRNFAFLGAGLVGVYVVILAAQALGGNSA